MSKRKYDIKSYPGFFPITVLCLIILYTPLLVVMVYSLNDSNSITIWEGFSFRWYGDVFTGPESAKFKSAAWNSFTIAIIAATCSTTILAATAIVRGGKFKLRTVSFGLIGLPLMVPCHSDLFQLDWVYPRISHNPCRPYPGSPTCQSRPGCRG